MPTHGAISKAGKTKWKGIKPHKLPDSNRPKKKCPRLANRRKYEKREKQIPAGQRFHDR